MPYEILTAANIASIPTVQNCTLDAFYSLLVSKFDTRRKGELEQGCAPLTVDECQYVLVFQEMRRRGICPDCSGFHFWPTRTLPTSTRVSDPQHNST
jgi:hypothetical protein